MNRITLQIIKFSTCLSVASIFISCSGENTAINSVEKAETHIAKGDFNSADIEIKNALKADPDNVYALSAMGEILYKQGRLRDAYKILFPLIEQLSEDPDFLVQLASIEATAGLKEDARTKILDALKIDPNHEDGTLILVETAISAEDLVIIESELTKLPDSLVKKVALGNIAFRKGEIQVAEKQYEETLAENSNYVPAHIGMHAVYLFTKQYSLAEESLKKAAENSPMRSTFKVRYAQYLQSIDKVDLANEYIESITEASPGFLPAVSLQSELAFQLRDFDKAESLAGKALALDPIDPTALGIHALSLAKKGEYDEAVEIFQKATELYPDNLKVKFYLALTYVVQDKQLPAMQELAEIVSANPSHYRAAALLSNLQISNKDFRNAQNTLEQLIANAPGNLDARIMLADVYNKQSNYRKALEIYNSIIEEESSDYNILYLSAITKLQLKEFEEARADLNQVLNHRPDHISAINQLTNLNLAEGNIDSARERLDLAIQEFPELSALHELKGNLEFSDGKIEISISSFRKSILLDPKNREAYIMLSRALQAENSSTEAIEILEKALIEIENDIGILTIVAGLYEKEGELATAIEKYEQILSLSSDFLPALNNLAYLYSQSNDKLDKALELAQKARKLAPNDPYTADTLGWIAFKKSDFSWALSLLQEGAASLSNHPEVAYHLGSALYYLGRLDEAKPYLEMATETDVDHPGTEDAGKKLRILKIDPTTITSDEKLELETASSAGIGDPTAFEKLGTIEEIKGDKRKADEFYRSAVTISSEHRGANLGLARILIGNNQLDEAKPLLDTAIRTNPTSHEALYLQGKLAYANRNYARAASLLQEATRFATDATYIQPELAQSMLANGQIDQALEAARKGTFSDTPNFVSNLEFIKGIGEYHESDYTALDSQLSDAVAALKNENIDDALIKFERILQEFPNQSQAILGTAKVLSREATNARKVYDLASQVRERMPDNLESRALQAISQYHLNNYAAANRTWQAFRTEELLDPEWNYYYGLTLIEVGDYEKATTQLDIAIERNFDNEKVSKAKENILSKTE